MARRNDDYDWLDDPFDEKKAAEERERAAVSGRAKAALGCGCLAALGLAVLAVVATVAALGSLSL
ncbi:hypothetical protein [Rubneribacter badeniensis]|uniref:Uncharacterized protein n=1 Tax=Rubneribacter badeniensis TaxID=2070688 RepID=A0A2K2U7C2_9ACTN|nr:hypothetical protein [Rubneribacter badeniensis]OUO96255.1 hypothetical protein B5F41_02790 [Gordonibacter sp. An232A]PNV66226.1 hypothetical protein C2L80_02080 [Rubneribacter badeniensis]CVH79388.1 hypothetical protein BN3658_01933 [Coriobacteriaceae bacterium CHKCI002]HJH43441.1 hypothetical protein [Rubneribacter badeniensis]